METVSRCGRHTSISPFIEIFPCFTQSWFGQLASAINESTSWDLVLYLEPDVAFVQDGTRNEIIHQDREKYSAQIKQLLQAHNIPYQVINGDYLQRFEKAKQLIEQHLGITTRF